MIDMMRLKIVALTSLSLAFLGCSGATGEDRPDGWKSESHGKLDTPNVTKAFMESEVQTWTITVDSAEWQKQQDDIANNYGKFGVEPETDPVFDPIYIPVTLMVDSLVWNHVGMRIKGAKAWEKANLKNSFKLDFDEFEDTYSEIKNQRYWGYKQLILHNNREDDSYMREKLVNDIFQAQGIAASHTSFIKLNIDFGEGKKYFGLYTLMEDIDDNVVKARFGNNDGNLYEPLNDAASFQEGTYGDEFFENKTNEESTDKSDVKALYDHLHKDSRETDYATWLQELDGMFDISTFLKWLAINTVLQNDKTYGAKLGNYLLYKNTADSKFYWVPDDNSDALKSDKDALDFDLAGVTDKWPFIHYVIADETRFTEYKSHMQTFLDTDFKDLGAKVTQLGNLIADAVHAEDDPDYTFVENKADHTANLERLQKHITSQATGAQTFLNKD